MWKTTSPPLCCLFTLRLFPLSIFCYWLWGTHILDAHDMFYISFVSGEDSSIPLWPMHCHCNCSVIPISLLMNSPLCIVFFFSCCYLVFILLLCHHLSSSPVYPRIYSRCPSAHHYSILSSVTITTTLSAVPPPLRYTYWYWYISLILIAYALLTSYQLRHSATTTQSTNHYRRCIRLSADWFGGKLLSYIVRRDMRRRLYCNHWHRYFNYNVDHSHMYHGREREDRGQGYRMKDLSMSTPTQGRLNIIHPI